MTFAAIMQGAGSLPIPTCSVPGPLDWPNLLYTVISAIALALLTHVTQITRRLDKEVRDGGE